MRQVGFLKIIINSYDVEAINESDATNKFYDRFSTHNYEIVSVNRTYIFGCLTGTSLFWLILFIIILLINLF